MNTPINSLVPVSPPSSVNTTATDDEQSNLSFGEIFDSLTLASNVEQEATKENIPAQAGFSLKKNNTKSDISLDEELIDNGQLNSTLPPLTLKDNNLDSTTPSDGGQTVTKIESSLLGLDQTYTNYPLISTTPVNIPTNGVYSTTTPSSTNQSSDDSQVFMALTVQSRELAQPQAQGEFANLEQKIEPTQLFPSISPSSVASYTSTKKNIHTKLDTTDDQATIVSRLDASYSDSPFDTKSSLSRLSVGVISGGNQKELPPYFTNSTLKASLQQFGLSLSSKTVESLELANESTVSQTNIEAETNLSNTTNPQVDSQDLAFTIPTNLSTTGVKALPQVPGAPISIYDRAFSEHLNHSIKWIHSNQLNQAEINLNPRDLGPITVHLHLDGNQAKIFLAAEHSNTRQVLEETLSQLQDSLTQGGLNLSESHVGTQSQGQSFQDNQKNLLAQSTSALSQTPETLSSNEESGSPIRNSDHLVDFFA